MIALVTGAPGAGKSYYSVRVIAEALEAGKSVATNVALTPGWAMRVASANPIRWLVPGGRRRRAAEYERRLLVTDDLEELFRVRLEGNGEGRGVMVLDECHNWLNARTWDSDPTGRHTDKAGAVQARLAVVRFFSQHRKLGWDVYAITQDAQNIDRQVRTLFEYHIKLKNLRNFKAAGLRIIPFNLFLALWFWNDGAKTLVKRQCYRLTRVARIYDTMALSHGLEDDDVDAILLPRPKPPPIELVAPPAEDDVEAAA